MKVSVIIPTYNRAHLVCDTLDSLCKQDLSADKYEVLVVNNNSKDDTKAIVEQYISNHSQYTIRYIFEPQQGDHFARNRGAEEARGMYLVFSDDDALFDTSYLSTIVELFEKYPDVGAVGTRINIQWEGGKPAKWVAKYEHLLGAISYRSNGYIIQSSGLFINNGSLAVKRELYMSVGGINPAQVGDYVIGDAEGGFCRKLHKLGIPMAFTDDVTMWHRQFVGKNDTIKDIRRRYENIGITHAYTDVIVNNIIKKDSYCKDILKMIWFSITGRKRKALYQYFKTCEIIKYNEYVDRFLFDSQLKGKLSSYTY